MDQFSYKVAVVGLGYVGLPLAIAFAEEGCEVLGFDINPSKIERLKNGIDDTGENDLEKLTQANIVYSSDAQVLSQADYLIVSVPTPVDNQNVPDLTPIIKASELIGKYIKKGATVIYESTVYPGVTEEICQPIIERESGMRVGVDWKIAYSPERINPGDKEHNLKTVVKVVSGMDEETLESVAALYQTVCKAGVFRASSIKVAEAEKLIENIQRDVNIALMNELSMIFAQLEINTQDVIEAASTKWNFHKYTPGLVGGHCIGVDPYYLVHQSKQLSLEANLIAVSRRINDSMPEYIAGSVLRAMIAKRKDIEGTRVLVAGLAFKENVKDIRNSKSVEVVRSLMGLGVEVEAYDPLLDPIQETEFAGITIVKSLSGKYDAIIMPVCHSEFLEEQFISQLIRCTEVGTLLFDLKGLIKKRGLSVEHFTYKSL